MTTKRRKEIKLLGTTIYRHCKEQLKLPPPVCSSNSGTNATVNQQGIISKISKVWDTMLVLSKGFFLASSLASPT